MAKTNNLKDFLIDLYEGIASKKPNASRNPQDFRSEIESISGGGGIEEVSEFPTENVKDEVIYKRSYTVNKIYLKSSEGWGDKLWLFSDILNLIGMGSAYYYEVEELPSDMLESSFDFHVYIVNGVGYAKTDLTGEGVISVVTLGEMFGVENKTINSLEEINNITEDGVYIFSGTAIEYGVKNETFNYINDEWSNYSELLKGIIEKTIEEVNLPTITKIGLYFFSANLILKNVNLLNVTEIDNFAFCGCWALKKINIPNILLIGEEAFSGCYSLKALVIRQVIRVCQLGRNVFKACYHILGTTHENFNPTGAKDGYIYVPKALVEDYKSATNWSEYASQIRALEDYTIDGTLNGELDESKVNA